MKINDFNYSAYGNINENLCFGKKRIDVRKIYSQYKEFIKNIYENNSCDHYDDCNIYYDENDELEFVETAPECSVKFENIEISKGKKYGEVKKILSKFDDSFVEDEVGVVYYKLGLGIYIENKDFDNRDFEKIQSVYFFKKGYYD